MCKKCLKLRERWIASEKAGYKDSYKKLRAYARQKKVHGNFRYPGSERIRV